MASSSFINRPTDKFNTTVKHRRIPAAGGGAASQVGQTQAAMYGYRLQQALHAPNFNTLAEYENAMNVDATIGTGMEFLKLSLIASLGEYQNKDKKIQDFVRANMDHMGSNLMQIIGELIVSNLWAGFGCSEILWTIQDGQTWIDDILSLHPASILFVVNEKGRLTQGEKPAERQYLYTSHTGIWQYQNSGLPKNIPLNKVVYTTHNKRYNNYYGISAFSRIYPHYLMKTLIYPNQVNALERFATPLIYMTVPRAKSSKRTADPANPELETYLSYAQEAEIALENLHNSNGIVLEDPGEPYRQPEIDIIGTENNFGDIFIEAIKHQDKQIYRGLLLPSQLIDDSLGTFNQTSLEVQFEQFKQHLRSLYSEVVEPFLEMCVARLIYMNYGSVDDVGRFPLRMIDPVTRRLQMDIFTAMADRGVLDVSNVKDLQYFRDMMGEFPKLDDTELETASKGAADIRKDRIRELAVENRSLQGQLKQQRITLRNQQLNHDTRVRQDASQHDSLVEKLKIQNAITTAEKDFCAKGKPIEICGKLGGTITVEEIADASAQHAAEEMQAPASQPSNNSQPSSQPNEESTKEPPTNAGGGTGN